MTNVKFSRRPFEGTFNNFVDDLFSELPGLFNNDFNKSARRTTVPVNVKESENSYELEVVAPGFEKTDFKISIDDNMLTIAAEKKVEATAANENGTKSKSLRNEYTFGSFKRSFTLDEKIDATNIAASYINGVLTLNLPKKVEVKTPAKEIVIN